MSIGCSILKTMNNIFPKQVHPFNLQNCGCKTYAMWQYEKGLSTIELYLNYSNTDEMFKDKMVLDFGCGAGGKSLYYASLGAKKVVGVDVIPDYESESKNLAEELGLSDKFEFIIGDASDLPFDDESFDTIIMNDFMEHISTPEHALLEAKRLIKKGGRIYINFPPYNHPFGAHLSDVINIPWVHMFFHEKTLINVYKDYVKDLKDGENRIKFRISKQKNGQEYFSYTNKMSIKRFNKIMKRLDIHPIYYNEIALRNFFKIPAKLPLLKEMFVKMVVCVIEK